MRIGIIGAGHIGSTLARQFSAAGHEVAVANSRGPSTLTGLVDALGDRVRAVTAEEAADFGPVLVVAVPFGRHRELPVPAAGRIVVDTTNYYPERDGNHPELDADRTTSSELLQAHLAGSRVVKAFNTMRWDHLRDYGHEAGAIDRYGIPVSGDDPTAKRVVEDLVEQLGYQPMDAGSLAMGGRHQQPGGPVFGVDLVADELRARLGRPAY
ncbi:MAG TPA: NAD(P)-binding domain-containing protein [Micromonospora sp.]